MIRTVKWFVVIGFIFGGLLWGGMRLAEHMLIRRLPMWMANISSPMLVVQTEEIQAENCWWQVCVQVKGVQLGLPGSEIVRVGDIYLKVSPFHPMRVDIRTAPDMPFVVEATLGKQVWDIRRAIGKIGSFEFQMTGQIDGKKNQGSLLVQTVGLRQFINQFMEVPVWLSFLIQDIPQQITLTPQNGMLTLFGIPLFPI